MTKAKILFISVLLSILHQHDAKSADTNQQNVNGSKPQSPTIFPVDTQNTQYRKEMAQILSQMHEECSERLEDMATLQLQELDELNNSLANTLVEKTSSSQDAVSSKEPITGHKRQ